MLASFTPRLASLRRSSSAAAANGAILAITMLLIAGNPPLIAQPAGDDKEAAAPNAALIDPVYDFGPVPAGEVLTHEFQIRNQGTATLELFAAESTCGCTIVAHDEEIEPGAIGRIRVDLDTSTQNGAFAVTVAILTNDLDNAKLRMTLKAELTSPIEVRPGWARFRSYQGAPARGVTQTLWATDGIAMHVLSVESPYPFVESSFHPTTEQERLEDGGPQQWTVRSILLPEAPVGPLDGMLVINTDHPEQTQLRIPLFGIVEPVFSVVPDVLDFAAIEPSSGIRGSVLVKRNSKDEYRVTAAEVSIAGARVEIKDHADSSIAQHVVVHLPSTLGPGVFEGVLRIQTDSPLQPQIEVAIRGTVR